MSSEKFTPFYDRILVKQEDEQESEVGGLLIADIAKERPQRGTVIRYGIGRISKEGTITPLLVRVGDTVLFGKYAGTEVKIDGSTYLIMREDEVLGVAA